jgi:hypothetical protein
MGEQAELIARHIERQHAEVRDDLMELKQAVSRSVDWRAHVQERPLPMVGLAFGGGFLLSTLLGSRSRPDVARMSDDRHAFQESAIHETWDTLKRAAIALAATKLKEVVEDVFPGFQDEYQKAEIARR